MIWTFRWGNSPCGCRSNNCTVVKAERWKKWINFCWAVTDFQLEVQIGSYFSLLDSVRVEERCSGGEHIFHLFSTPLPRPLLQTHFTISTIVSTSTWKVCHQNALYHFYQCANKTHFTISTIVSIWKRTVRKSQKIIANTLYHFCHCLDLKTHSGEKSKNCCKHTLPFLPLHWLPYPPSWNFRPRKRVT